MVITRELKKEDIPQLLDLYIELLKDHYERNKYSKEITKPYRGFDYYTEIINSDKSTIFLGVDGSLVVGSATVVINEPGFFFEFDKHAYVYDGFVKAEYRATKLSFSLYNECEKWAREKGSKYVATYTYYFNKKVQTCFKAKKMEPYKVTYIKELN